MVVRKALEEEMLNNDFLIEEPSSSGSTILSEQITLSVARRMLQVAVATEPNVVELLKRVEALEKEKKRKRETVRKYSQEGKKEAPKKKKLRKEKTHNQPFTQQETQPTSTERFCDYCDVKRHTTQACFKELKKHKREKAKQQSEFPKLETRKREESTLTVPNSNNMM